MSYLSDDIAMAAVNEAKVVDINETIKEAKSLLDSHLIDTSHSVAIQEALNTINKFEDYQLQPETVKEVDETINNVGNVLINRGEEVELVTGTESFGLTMSPKEWRKSRISGCESILSELSKNIKYYANKLSEKLSDIFTGHRYSIDSLTSRLAEADKKLMSIETLRKDIEFVSVNKFINKTLLVKDRVITPNPNVDKIIQSEINYIGMALKSWSSESTSYKNKLIKYFGNKGRGDIKSLTRPRPKLFSKKSFIDDENSDQVFFTIPERFIGMGSIFFSEYQKSPSTLSELAKFSSFNGYDFVKDYNGRDAASDMNLKPLSISQLESISSSVKLCINLMSLINESENDFDISNSDIKDIANTLKTEDDEELLSTFYEVISHYQQNTTFTQSSFIEYFGKIASALITYMFIHMEGYDES